MDKIKMILREFSEKPIAYQPIYSKITGSITSGILLSQLVYWYFAMDENEFYKTDKEFCDELAMGLWELKGAKNKLQELKIIRTKRKGIPAKTYYNININKIISLITSCGKNQQQEEGKTNNKKKEKPTTIYTENTTENTTENIMQAEACGSINLLIEKFKQINPSYERLFSNKTQREALKRLIKKYTKEKVEAMIDALPGIVNQKYAPQISNPVQLENKLGQLLIFIKQNEKQKKGYIQV